MTMTARSLCAVLLLAGVSQAAPLTVTLTGECYETYDWNDLAGQCVYQIGDVLTVTFQYDPDTMVRTIDEPFVEDLMEHWVVLLETTLDSLAWVVTRGPHIFTIGQLSDYAESRVQTWSDSQGDRLGLMSRWEERFHVSASGTDTGYASITLTFHDGHWTDRPDPFAFMDPGWYGWLSPFEARTVLDPGDYDGPDPFEPRALLDPDGYDGAVLRIRTRDDSELFGTVACFSLTGYTVTPEPVTALMLAVGGIAILRRRKR